MNDDWFAQHHYDYLRENALKWGVMLKDFLPCKRHSCALADPCPVLEEPDTTHLCVRGQPCPWEVDFHRVFVANGRHSFAYARRWLSEAELDEALGELAMIEIRRRRLSARVAHEGLLRKREIAPGVSKLEVGLGAGRYATALDNEWDAVMKKLLSPDDLPEPEEMPRPVGSNSLATS